MYRFIDSLPIEPEEIENSQTSIQSNTLYLEQLRLIYKSMSTLDIVSETQSFLSEAIKKEEEDFLPFFIESSLLSLLYTSSINNPLRSYRSPHYLSRSYYITPYKSKAPIFYRKEIALSNLRTWGGLYGMPSYSLHLMGDTNHYLTPYEIADKVITYYLNSLSINDEWKSLSDSDYLSDSFNPYEISHLLITRDRGIYNCYQILHNLSSFFPKLILTYQEDSTLLNPYMKDLANLLILYGLDNINNLHYRYIHQYLGREWDEFFPEMIRLRKRSPSIKDELTEEFIQSIPITTREELYRDSSNNLLAWVCAPGGYNLLLLVVALALLNRAYCQSIAKNYRESNRSIYDAALCLRKSNLPHIQRLGSNLLIVLNNPDAPLSTDLLQ